MLEHQHPVAERAADPGSDDVVLRRPAVVVRHHLHRAGLPPTRAFATSSRSASRKVAEGVSGHLPHCRSRAQASSMYLPSKCALEVCPRGWLPVVVGDHPVSACGNTSLTR